jgi:hypothetical protein
LKFTWKLSDILYKSNFVKPWMLGFEGAIIGQTVFTCVYIGKCFYPLAQLAVKGI